MAIEGLKLTVVGSELSDHCKNRYEFHAGRAKIYNEEVEKVKQLRKESDETTRQISKSVNSDPVESLEASAKKHEARARFFKFAATHFEPSTIYMLGMTDLEAVEIMPNRY